MLKVLVTGGIASGKSEMCRYIAGLGYPVYDSDSRAKSLYETVPGLKERIEREVGLPFDELKTVFGDTRKLEVLNGIVHPLVLSDFREWCLRQDSQIVFFESAIALESPCFKDFFDRVILVEAPLHLRVKRNPKAVLRDTLQNFDMVKADYTVRNDSGIDSLYENTANIIAGLECLLQEKGK